MTTPTSEETQRLLPAAQANGVTYSPPPSEEELCSGLRRRRPTAVTGSTVESFWSELEKNDQDAIVRPLIREDSHVHQFSPADMDQMSRKLESIDTRYAHTLAYRRYLSQAQPTSSLMKWALFTLIGVVIGVIGFFVLESSSFLAHTRRDILTWAYKRARESGQFGDYLLAFVLWLIPGACLAAISMLICRWCPAAGGSGVTDCMAYLNGVFFKKVFNIKTLVAKTFSCICAVSSGLPVGPEGPMIHIGSIIGATIGSGRSKALQFSFNKYFRVIRNPKDHRDAITAGAACGVAVAFGAPIGGLLFVSEEIATHWHPSLTPMIFTCCLVGVFVYGLFASQLDGFALRHETNFGGLIDEATILFNSVSDRHMYARDIIFAAAIGLLTGVSAIAFTRINLFIMKRRIKASPLIRSMEPVIVALVFLSLSFVAPALFACADMPPEDDNSTAPIDSADQDDVYKLYLTAPCDDPEHFSAAASLFWNPGEGVIKILFRKHSPFGTAPLLFFMVSYFAFSVYSAGLALSCGIVIPMLVTGGAIGRLCGKFIVTYLDDTQHEGIYAIIGAAGYFAGVSRLSAALAVIMIELTNEKRILLPLMIAILVAKLLADHSTHAFYHGLLELRNVPFLDSTEIEKLTMKHWTCFRAADVCRTRIVCLRPMETVENLVSVLKTCKHNGFPVVDSDTGLHFLGMISRQQIHALLWNLEDGWDPASGNVAADRMDPAWELLMDLEEQHFVRNELEPAIVQSEDSPLLQAEVNLLYHTDSSALSVNPAVSVTVVFEMFTSLGLRHLAVVNERGVVVGMITRKDLLASKLQKRMLRSIGTLQADGLQQSVNEHLDSEEEEWVVCDKATAEKEHFF
ncbi:Chloride channel protein C [Diplonema papillatum]|nr:Chloride channel protein C [Diplonema papillatum]